MNPNKVLVDLIYEFIRRANFCIYATNEPRVISEGGLITASKTYLKCAILTIEKLETLTNEDKEKLKECIKLLETLINVDQKKLMQKFDISNDVVRKKMERVRYVAKWCRNKLLQKMLM